MSILDALRVQKANQQSVSQLAALPQNEIIRLAQMGHIPADVVPVVISEKARMAKEMANLQAAAQTQGRPMPTVIEQAMQANAQAESGMPPQAPPQPPQTPPQMPPQAPPPGVAGLPTGQMFQGQNFESGGIVAFGEGGTPEMPSKGLMRAFANVSKDRTTGKDVEVLMAGLGMDEGMLGVNVAKISGDQREDLAKMLVAQYNTKMGDLNLSGQVVKPMDGPSGTYQFGAQASYPMAGGRISAGLGALRTPQQTSIANTNIGYETALGPGRLAAGVNFPRGASPQAQMRYQMRFEEGGVVGYNGTDDSFVEGPTGLKVLQSEITPGRRMPSLADAISTARTQLAPSFAESPEEAAFREALRRGMSSPEERSQQKYMRLLEAGLGIMGGESPYALSNIGKGSQAALRGYGEDVRAQQAQRLAELKAAAETARGKRLEGAKAVELGAQIYGKELENAYRTASLNRNTDFQRRVTNFIPEAMAELEINDPKDPRVIALATRKADQSAGLAQQRIDSAAATARGAQDLGYANIDQRFITEATRGVDNALAKPGSLDSREFRRLRKEDPNLTLDDYRTALIRQRAQEASDLAKERRPGAAPATQSPGAPRSVPQGGQAAAPSAAPPASSPQYKIGETFVIQSGPHKGKTAEWDGTGFKLKD